MKRNIGAVNALYPTPVVLVGAEVNGRINYCTIAHVGIIDMKTLSLSMNKSHYSNIGIKENMTLSINIPSDDMVEKVDFVGLVSGIKYDKSNIFDSFYGQLKGAPMIQAAPISMECTVVNIIEMPTHEVFFVEPINTYCKEEILLNNKIDFAKVKPILFDMPRRKYWRLGESFADCWSIGRGYKSL
jgi:flavin reductase (DIM6/NTAB) family NADH-FMN oxidoreductase RutF